MVSAAVHAAVASTHIQSILGMGFAASTDEPTLQATVAVAQAAVARLPGVPEGPVVAERGEFYEEPEWSVESHFDVEPQFKYVESIAERETVEAAHHAAYGARKLLL